MRGRTAKPYTRTATRKFIFPCSVYDEEEYQLNPVNAQFDESGDQIYTQTHGQLVRSNTNSQLTTM